MRPLSCRPMTPGMLTLTCTCLRTTTTPPTSLGASIYDVRRVGGRGGLRNSTNLQANSIDFADKEVNKYQHSVGVIYGRPLSGQSTRCGLGPRRNALQCIPVVRSLVLSGKHSPYNQGDLAHAHDHFFYHNAHSVTQQIDLKSGVL